MKYLGYFWTTLQITLVNYENNIFLTWSANCVNCKVDRAITFGETHKEAFSSGTLSGQDNTKLLQQ